MRILLLIFILFSSSLEKKASKTLYKYYGEEVLLTENKSNNTGTFYNIEGKEDILFIGSSPSKYETFDFMAVICRDKSIKLVEILVYRESYGGEIGSRRWLRQFIGMDKPKPIVQGISGATISVNSLKYSLNKLIKEL